MTRLFVPVVLGVAACVGPQVSDEPGPHPDILPAGSEVPAADDDPALRAQLETHDGIESTIPLINGFAAGAPTRTWDFGPAPDFVAPLFVLVARDAAGALAPIDHNTIVEAIPGDPGYSPYWGVYFVEVTDHYRGERLTSFEAIGAAVSAGLVEPPVGQPVAVNCPAVALDVTLDLGDGTSIPPPARFYYRGRTVSYFDFGPMPLAADRVHVPETSRYLVRREGGEPLSEPLRNVDIVGDGDLDDTNDIYQWAAEDTQRSPLCRTIDVAVAASTASIDTSGDASIADLRAASQLFDPAPVPGVVTAFAAGAELRNCVGQRAGWP
ncbi:MAG: hypothetical protein SFX73_13445 [Kofleriaceae bacterium]|nr:hypothetical protein [Kofleriaceae bacterium]